jgi:hypothetical protein
MSATRRATAPERLPVCGPPGLSSGERILLWMMRQWATARMLDQDPAARVSFYALSLTSAACVSLAVQLMLVIEQNVRRPLRIRQPQCLHYDGDEQSLVVACGLSPVAPDMAAHLLEDLVTAPPLVTAMLRAVNCTFSLAEHDLPVRMRQGPEPAAEFSEATVH